MTSGEIMLVIIFSWMMGAYTWAFVDSTVEGKDRVTAAVWGVMLLGTSVVASVVLENAYWICVSVVIMIIALYAMSLIYKSKATTNRQSQDSHNVGL